MTLIDLLHRHRLCLALAAGFYLAINSSLSVCLIPFAWFLGLVVLALVAIQCWSFAKKTGRDVRVVLLFAIGMVLALFSQWRMAVDIQSHEFPMYGLPPKLIEGFLINDSKRKGDESRLELELDRIWTANGASLSGIWRVRATVSSRQQFWSGSRVRLAVDSTYVQEDQYTPVQIAGRLVDMEPAGGILALRAQVLCRVEASLDALPDGERGLAEALLLGRLDGLDPELQRYFYQSGCAHLVALSGMHVALVAGAMVRICRPLLGAVAGRLTGMGGALLLIGLVGPFPSALRALAMFLVYQLSALWGYRSSLLSCLLFSGPLIAVVDPALCLTLGFQLSFWALLGILTVQEWWKENLRRGLKPWLAQELATGLSAQFATLPVLMIQGLPIHLQGLIAGIVLAPLVLAYLAASALALAFGLVPGIGASVCLAPLLSALYQLIRLAGSGFVA